MNAALSRIVRILLQIWNLCSFFRKSVALPPERYDSDIAGRSFRHSRLRQHRYSRRSALRAKEAEDDSEICRSCQNSGTERTDHPGVDQNSKEIRFWRTATLYEYLSIHLRYGSWRSAFPSAIRSAMVQMQMSIFGFPVELLRKLTKGFDSAPEWHDGGRLLNADESRRRKSWSAGKSKTKRLENHKGAISQIIYQIAIAARVVLSSLG